MTPVTTPAIHRDAQHEQLTRQVRVWVSQTFFGELLKQMDNSPFRSELFSGGRGGQAFAPLLHQHLVDRMARGAGDKLVNSIVRRIETRSGMRQANVAARTGT